MGFSSACLFAFTLFGTRARTHTFSFPSSIIQKKSNRVMGLIALGTKATEPSNVPPPPPPLPFLFHERREGRERGVEVRTSFLWQSDALIWWRETRWGRGGVAVGRGCDPFTSCELFIFMILPSTFPQMAGANDDAQHG